MRDSKLPGDVAWPDALVRHLDDPLTDNVWKWSPVDEDSAKLVHAAVTCSYTSIGVGATFQPRSTSVYQATEGYLHETIACKVVSIKLDDLYT